MGPTQLTKRRKLTDMIGTDNGSFVDIICIGSTESFFLGIDEPVYVLCPLGEVGGVITLVPPGRADDINSWGSTDSDGELGVEFVLLRVVGDGGGDGFGSGVVILGAGRRERCSGDVDCRSVAAGGMPT